MKVLWLSPTPSKYEKSKYGYNGGGWIESLQSLYETSAEIDQLAIAFPHLSHTKKVTEEKVTYYPIRRVMPGNIVSWILSNWKNNIEYEEEINELESILKDFEPDIVHIFGTENWFSHAVKMTNKPCVVHIQGLMLPCHNAYFPTGLSKSDLLKNNWIEWIKGISLWHNERVFEKKSKREYQFMKDISYFMGRTLWDKSIAGFLSPNSTYFHVDEVLRDKFYTAPPWKYTNRSKTIITSTLSDALYKGLDLVIKTSALLVKENYAFEWRIIGVNDHSQTVRLLKKALGLHPPASIRFLGIKNIDEIIGYLSETTLYIHPSYIDNSPNSLCEAQLLGVPVIATNVGGVSSLVEDGKNGYLVPANDPYYLASKIIHLSQNQALLENISEQARSISRIRHSKENILTQITGIYKYLAKENEE